MENTNTNSSTAKKLLTMLPLLLLLLAVPLTLSLMQQNQDLRQRAAAPDVPNPTERPSPTTTSNATTVLSLIADSNSITLGDTVAIDVFIDPGKNQATLIKLEMLYDTALLKASEAAVFVPNTAVVPTVIEGPVITDGSMLTTLSIGSDPNNAINSKEKVGTLYLIATGTPSDAAAQVTFGGKSEVLSIAQEDRADENVLAETLPLSLSIKALPTPTTIAIASPSPTLVPTVGPTTLSFTVLLNGIGNAGDKSNRNGKGNSNPITKERTLQVDIYNSQNILATTVETQLTYNETTGSFVGNADVSSLPEGVYQLRVNTNRYLRDTLDTIITITKGQTIQVPPFSLVNGDVNGDNRIDIRDYNIIGDCYSDFAPAKNCSSEGKRMADLNDDGKVNQFDFNLYLRETSVRDGD